MKISKKATIASKIMAVLEGLRAQGSVPRERGDVCASTLLARAGIAPEDKMIILSKARAYLCSGEGFTKGRQTCRSRGAMVLSEPVETRQKQGPMGGLGDGGNMAAAGAGCGLYKRTSLCRSAFLILNLVMPKPLDLPILPYGTHFTVSLSEQPLRESSVHWSKACSSA